MSFEIDGETWQPKTAAEHTLDIENKINTLLKENNITDEDGNALQLKANFANAFHLLALASGTRYAVNDQKLAAAINSFNIALCDDAQIENLLPIAALDRNPGSYSTLVLSCTVAPGDICTIAAGTKAPFGDVYFVVDNDTLIDNSSGTEPLTQQVATTCDTIGPVAVLSGEVNSFENSVAGLSSVTNNESSVPGTPAETVNELRAKLTQGNTIKYTVDGCKSALEELTGIAYARVYFNYNTTVPITLPGGVVVQPRHAYIVVHGSGFDGLADVYAEYMSAPTQNAPNATDTAREQNYVTSSGQLIPIKFDTAGESTVYVKVLLQPDAEDTNEIENQLRRDLITASADWEIGQNVTSLLVGNPIADVAYTKVAYCEVSADGETWGQLAEVDCNVIPRLTDESISVEVLN